MDRDRLKDVRQTDLTEGRINQDFLDWMKTKGTSWLLVVVIALFAYAAFVKWKGHRLNYQTEGWTELNEASLPSSLEDVAEKYADVSSVAHLARLRGAARLVLAVQSDKTLAAAGETSTSLTPEMRTEYLDRADRLYARLLQDDDGSNRLALMMAAALNGRAAIAESRSQFDEARALYTKAADRIRSDYPTLAARADDRAATLNHLTSDVKLVTGTELSTMQQSQPKPPTLDPVWNEPWLNEMLTPQQ